MVTLITVGPGTHACPSAPLRRHPVLANDPAPSTSSSYLPSSLTPSVSRFFYSSFEALFNFCRGIFPAHGDYCSQEMEENRSRELPCAGAATRPTPEGEGNGHSRRPRKSFGNASIIRLFAGNHPSCSSGLLDRTDSHMTLSTINPFAGGGRSVEVFNVFWRDVDDI